jgi:type IV fimbrial biogenesis protein FimT
MLHSKMKAKQSGFTLLEMMIAIALLAALLSFGLPNFRDFVRNARMAAAANDLLADMNFARSEAIKRRVPVTLCKLNADGDDCDDDDDTPFRRWIVFVDDADAAAEDAADGDGTVDGGEAILRTSGISAEIDHATATGLFSTFIASGFIRPNVDNLQQVVFCDSRGNTVTSGGESAARAITITATGRAVLTRDIAIIENQLGGCP